MPLAQGFVKPLLVYNIPFSVDVLQNGASRDDGQVFRLAMSAWLIMSAILTVLTVAGLFRFYTLITLFHHF